MVVLFSSLADDADADVEATVSSFFSLGRERVETVPFVCLCWEEKEDPPFDRQARKSKSFLTRL